MAEEYLNIDYHIKRLLLIAINKFKTEKEQAEALGVTTKTLYNYRKKYSLNVQYRIPKKIWEQKNNKK